MRLSIIIPLYNEAATVQVLLAKVLAAPLSIEKEIIIIDDASTDASLSQVQEFIQANPGNKIEVINSATNAGKGHALQLGIAKASGDFVIFQDADLEYEPNEYQSLLDPLINGEADVVYGSRFIGLRARRLTSYLHVMANKFLTFLTNLINNTSFTDMETCYKVFRRETIQSLKLKEKRFGIEPEITSKISRIPNIRIFELPISYYARNHSEGKKIKWTDGFKAIVYILKYGFFD